MKKAGMSMNMSLYSLSGGDEDEISVIGVVNEYMRMKINFSLEMDME